MAWSQQKCIAYLEAIRWNFIPQCPYCGSKHSSMIEQGLRHHCNECFTSFSVTVGTLFHKTHVDLQKWFEAISIILKAEKPISVRQLARRIGVSKNTAAYIIKRLSNATHEDRKLIEAILDDDLFSDAQEDKS